MKTRPGAWTTLALLALALVLAACASGAGAGAPAHGSMDRITEEELDPVSHLSAFEAIERLRPRWFQTRTRLFPTVHVDGSVRAAGEEILASILCSEVHEMQYLSAADATTRFGTDYASGAILITTRK